MEKKFKYLSEKEIRSLGLFELTLFNARYLAV